MVRNFTRTAGVSLLFAAVALAGCEDEAALAQTKSEALASVAATTSKLTTASTALDAVGRKLSTLPQGTPGVSDLVAKITAQKAAVDSAEAAFSTLRGKLDLAASSKATLDPVVKEVADEVAKVGPLDATVADLTRAEASVETAATSPVAVAAADAPRKLPTGYPIVGAKDGFENRLLDFIQDPARPVDKTTWFDFDQVYFQAGGNLLHMGKSTTQLINLIELLKAYPKVKIKIGGYTDNTGPANANKKLSQERADAVKKALVAGGTEPERLAAEGYGPAFPVCAANDTEACKAQNRRIAVRVTAK